MRHIAAFLAVTLLLGACASSPDYKTRMSRWIGVTEKELVTSWGIPDKQYDVDRKTRMLAYYDHRSVNYGSGFSTCIGGVSGRFGYGNCIGGLPPQTETYYCETTFMLVAGRVTKWGNKGNGCRTP